MRTPHPATGLLAALALTLAFTAPARAALLTPGATAPAFTKNVLDSSPWPTASQSQFLGKVVVLHILGFDCMYCLADGPSVETDIVQYYNQHAAGQVQVLGCDVTDGTAAQLRSFRTNTGVTYPLLLRCWVSNLDPQNLVTYYGDRDHFVVINKQGIVRYSSALTWPYGQGYHLSEVRGAIDSLIVQGLGVGDAAPRLALSAGPSPAHGACTITLALPRAADAVRVDVCDVTGRRIATLHDGAESAGEHVFDWDTRDDAGRSEPAGVYLVRASGAGLALTRRIVVVR